MRWTFKMTEDGDVEIYDHNDEHVVTAENSNPPSIRWRNGVPTDPDVKDAICDYICEEIDSDDFPNEEAKMQYVQTAHTILASGRIEERDAE